MNREDAIFAGYYFTALADWMNGNSAAVPPAWRIAFSSADGRSVTGSGDLLLGMNAHVNRDLPFVLAAMGLVAPDGSSRKPDHDQINLMLNMVLGPLLQEESQRFDPAILNIATPFGVGGHRTAAAARGVAGRRLAECREAGFRPGRGNPGAGRELDRVFGRAGSANDPSRQRVPAPDHDHAGAGQILRDPAGEIVRLG